VVSPTSRNLPVDQLNRLQILMSPTAPGPAAAGAAASSAPVTVLHSGLPVPTLQAIPNKRRRSTDQAGSSGRATPPRPADDKTPGAAAAGPTASPPSAGKPRTSLEGKSLTVATPDPTAALFWPAAITTPDGATTPSLAGTPGGTRAIPLRPPTTEAVVTTRDLHLARPGTDSVQTVEVARGFEDAAQAVDEHFFRSLGLDHVVSNSGPGTPRSLVGTSSSSEMVVRGGGSTLTSPRATTPGTAGTSDGAGSVTSPRTTSSGLVVMPPLSALGAESSTYNTSALSPLAALVAMADAASAVEQQQQQQQQRQQRQQQPSPTSAQPPASSATSPPPVKAEP